MKLLIKICGITTPQDARLCVEAGADRLGVIFAPSSRRVSLAQAAIIARAVPHSPLVGVFRGCDPDLVMAAVQSANISLVQVHDCLDPEEWNRLSDHCRRPVLPALTVDQTRGDFDCHTLLLDLAKDPDLRSESHRRSLYDAAARLGKLGYPILVAGGLDPDNVAEAIRITECAGVDVCGGVESAPGQKDPELVRRFIAAARGFDRSPAQNSDEAHGGS